MRIISNSTWGMEIEGGCNEYSDGILSDLGFEMDYDSSVAVDTLHSDCEIKTSSYFLDDNVIKQTNKLIQYLNQINYQFNETAGIHIHIGGLRINEIIKLLFFMYSIEDIVYQLFPERVYNEHISLLTERDTQKIFEIPYQVIDVIQNPEILKEYLNYHCTISTCSYFDNFRGELRKTIEFRCFDSDYNFLPEYLDLVDKIIYCVKTKNSYGVQKFIKHIKNQPTEQLQKLLCELYVSESTSDKLIKKAIQAKAAQPAA